MINIELEVDKFISIRFTANAFLHHMIRNIVGTLLDIGTEKISPKDLLIKYFMQKIEMLLQKLHLRKAYIWQE